MFPKDASVHGHEIDNLFWLACKLTAPAFLIVLGILIYSMIRFRAREGHKALYTHGNSRRAVIMTLTLVTLVFIALDVNLAYHDALVFEDMFGHPPMEKDHPFRVRVEAEQFLWSFKLPGSDGSFDAPDAITTTGEIHVPEGRTVLFELRSRDVIHSFCLPNMRFKQDVVPGMTTWAYTEPNLPGRYEIMCAQLCGFGHYAMKGLLWVDEPAAFAKWLEQKRIEFGGVAR